MGGSLKPKLKKILELWRNISWTMTSQKRVPFEHLWTKVLGQSNEKKNQQNQEKVFF